MFGNEFGSIFRLSSMKPFIFKHFSHFYYLFIKIQNPQKALFSRLFSISTFLSWFGNFYRKGRVNDTKIYFDTPATYLRHEYNRYTLSVKYCCHLKCKIPRHTKRHHYLYHYKKWCLNFLLYQGSPYVVTLS